MTRTIPLLAVLALAGCASWFGVGAPAKVSEGVFVDDNGMTLYTYDRDTTGKSTCNGPCAINWPPLLAPAGAKATADWTLVTREDGQKQWAYKGRAVYTWSKDQQPGDRTGEGFNNLWRVAKP